MRVAHVDASAGVAGDMLLSAVLDLGAPLQSILDLYDNVGLSGVSIEPVIVERSGTRAQHLKIGYSGFRSNRSEFEILKALGHPAVPDRVSARAIAAFERIVAAERVVHGLGAHEPLHLHEIGSYDTVVDLLGVFFGLELMGVDKVSFSPISIGTGWTKAAHGEIPNPSPLVSRLINGMQVQKMPFHMEMTTPTGAALASVLHEEVKEVHGRLIGVGYGAGTMNPESHPNVLSITLTELDKAPGSLAQTVSVVEIYLDDLTGEEIGSLVDEAIAQGAIDGWTTLALGKKARPGLLLTTLWAFPIDSADVLWLHQRTGSPGLRIHSEGRSVLDRTFETVSVLGCSIRLKITELGMKAEFDDVRVASIELGMSPREVSSLAVSAFLKRRGIDSDR